MRGLPGMRKLPTRLRACRLRSEEHMGRLSVCVLRGEASGAQGRHAHACSGQLVGGGPLAGAGP